MTTSSIRQHPLLPWIGIAFLTLAALALRLYRLSDLGLWYDEAFSILIARRSWGAMNQVIFVDVHPPLYYYLLHLWGAESITWARGFSVLCSTLTIPLLFILTRRLLGTGGAFLASALLTIHPMHVYYAQELRMYAFQSLLILLLLASGLRLLSTENPPRRRHWIALAVLAWGVMATQYLGGALVAGVWIGLFLAHLGKNTPPPRWIATWAGCGAAALVGMFPFLFWGTRWKTLTEFQNDLPFSLRFIRDILDGFMGHIHSTPLHWIGNNGGEFYWDLACAIFLLLLLTVGVIVLLRTSRRKEAIFLSSVVSVCAFLLFLYDCSERRFFTRYFVLLLPASVMLYAAALSHGRRWLRFPAVGFLVLIFLSSSCFILSGEHRDTSGKLAKRISFQSKNRPQPPMLVENIALALTLKTFFPQADIRYASTRDALIPVEQAVFTDQDLVQTWPEDWRGRKVWMIMGGWGNLPQTPEELQSKTAEFAQRLGAPKGALRLYGVETVQGGFKWSALLEWAPQ
ncbi:TPA: hypothetical protein DDW35_12735 [Candidatus Sumerlaeota bacterium]|jgi:uncharacterized membrane protein|nr:hypothetical protein [Candidatus Sumerlaeota bacterium]